MRALQAADEAPRRRLAPGEGAAEALALDELAGAEVPVRGGGVARPLRRPCACAFGLAAQTHEDICGPNKTNQKNDKIIFA